MDLHASFKNIAIPKLESDAIVSAKKDSPGINVYSATKRYCLRLSGNPHMLIFTVVLYVVLLSMVLRGYSKSRDRINNYNRQINYIYDNDNTIPFINSKDGEKTDIDIKSKDIKSGWVRRINHQNLNEYRMEPSDFNKKEGGDFYLPNDSSTDLSKFRSPFIIQEEKEEIETQILAKRRRDQLYSKTQTIKRIAFFDPQKRRSDFLRKHKFDKCGPMNCKATTDVENADVVIFLFPKYGVEPDFKRKPGQLWVFYTVEAPARCSWFSFLQRPAFNSTMNLTISFRQNSDVPQLYGRLKPYVPNFNNDVHPGKNYTDIFQRKTKLAAWFVSHCQARSDRDRYVRKMQQIIDIDVYGLCGTKSCRGKDEDPSISTTEHGLDKEQWGKKIREEADKNSCLPMLSENYKFYIAFENTLCTDYITEKFFKIFDPSINTIPVVRGGSDYAKLFPPGTFIDASRFTTPESLAEFLYLLGSDEKRFTRYLMRKNSYQYVLEQAKWLCDLCDKIQDVKTPSAYTNLHHWWTHNTCADPKDFRQFK